MFLDVVEILVVLLNSSCDNKYLLILSKKLVSDTFLIFKDQFLLQNYI